MRAEAQPQLQQQQALQVMVYWIRSFSTYISDLFFASL